MTIERGIKCQQKWFIEELDLPSQRIYSPTAAFRVILIEKQSCFITCQIVYQNSHTPIHSKALQFFMYVGFLINAKLIIVTYLAQNSTSYWFKNLYKFEPFKILHEFCHSLFESKYKEITTIVYFRDETHHISKTFLSQKTGLSLIVRRNFDDVLGIRWFMKTLFFIKQAQDVSLFAIISLFIVVSTSNQKWFPISPGEYLVAWFIWRFWWIFIIFANQPIWWLEYWLFFVSDYALFLCFWTIDRWYGFMSEYVWCYMD